VGVVKEALVEQRYALDLARGFQQLDALCRNGKHMRLRSDLPKNPACGAPFGAPRENRYISGNGM